MAASAADVRSVFSIPDTSANAGPSLQKKPSISARKPEGISRELYSLIGPSAPSLAAQFSKPRLKQKPNLNRGGKSRWEWRLLKNNSRTDNLELYHWVKASTDPNADYPFEKYNTKATVYVYSQDEYTRFLEDTNWTKEETDYLFKIVQEFDFRWYIIYDRYDYQGGPTRSMEDLKDRYYSVCRKLVRNRPWAGDEASKAQLMASFQFDKEREQTRKKYLMSLENRTDEQIVEEEALYIEIKRLEQNERKFKKERDELLRTLSGIDSGLPEILEDDGASLGVTNDVKKRKKGGIMLDADSPATPSIISLTTPVTRKPQTTKSAASDVLHCIIRTDIASNTPATKAAHHPAYLRSFKLPVPKAAIAPKITQALAELGISHTRLVMPTRENCSQLESLLEATTALIETKRVVDKVDYDIQVLKNRLGIRESQSVDGDGQGARSVMDVDEADERAEGETEGDEGRAQSVASTKSARGRKHARRSMSISSVDTSVSTRAGVKRQKRT